MSFFYILDIDIVFLTFVCSSFGYFSNLLDKSNSTKIYLRNIGIYGNISGNFLLFILLVSRWFEAGYFPLSNLYESLLFLIWNISFLTMVIEIRTSFLLIGSMTIPLILFLMDFSTFSLPLNMQLPNALVPALKSNWLVMHVSVMILSYSLLLIGSLLSILFLILTFENKCRTEDLSFIMQGTTSKINPTIYFLISRLNLLSTIDNLSYILIGFGFPILTVGIISGAVWANEAWGTYWSWDPKETWALITWLIFASYIHSRIITSWEGQKPALIGSFGFFVVWVCYLGVNFVGKGLHTYGQVT